jgi:2'-5' RNA ligase
VSARLFAALELPGAVRAQLGDFGRAAAEHDVALRAVHDDALHVTLAFLGHRALAEVDPARAALLDAAGGAAAPLLALGAPLWLAPRRPRVLTVPLEDAGDVLAALQARVVEHLAAALGWEPESRPFRPHVTVARVRRGARPRTTGLPEAPAGTFAAPAVVLYRSFLGGGGPARYEPLERVALAS